LNAWKPELVHSLQAQHAALWLEPEADGRVAVRAANQIIALATRRNGGSPDRIGGGCGVMPCCLC
jgi:hypothetical protein